MIASAPSIALERSISPAKRIATNCFGRPSLKPLEFDALMALALFEMLIGCWLKTNDWHAWLCLGMVVEALLGICINYGENKMISILSRWRVQRRLAHVPKITMDVTRTYDMTFTAPNPDVKAVIKNQQGTTVGEACYAVSPLNDRVYVYDVEILSAYRRQGYGTALLNHLAQNYKIPITVVRELSSSCGFWKFARSLSCIGVHFTPQLSVSEMALESERWAHLQPRVNPFHETTPHS